MTITEEPIPGEKPALPPLPENLPMGKLVGMYVKLRDRIKAKDEEMKATLKPAKDMLEQLNNRILDELNKANVDSIKADTGTAYRTARTTASLADPQAFRDFVIANELFEMVDWKANAKAVQDHNEEFGALPPGVTVSTILQVGVRRPNEK